LGGGQELGEGARRRWELPCGHSLESAAPSAGFEELLFREQAELEQVRPEVAAVHHLPSQRLLHVSLRREAQLEDGGAQDRHGDTLRGRPTLPEIPNESGGCPPQRGKSSLQGKPASEGSAWRGELAAPLGECLCAAPVPCQRRGRRPRGTAHAPLSLRRERP